MGSTIIGIDHGYKNMKSANAMFATRLSRLGSKPDEMQMDGVVEFEGIYYTIYGSPFAAVNNHIKSESEEYYILTLASLGKEFRARGIQPGPNKIHVRLGCGLPQKWYDRQKESFKAMLWKNRELRFAYCGNTYNVVIEKCNGLHAGICGTAGIGMHHTEIRACGTGGYRWRDCGCDCLRRISSAS